MRRIAYSLLVAALALALPACTSIDTEALQIAPVATAASGASAVGRVAVRNPRYGDRKPHAWKARTPQSYPVHGTDVSKYQNRVDWQEAKASGISFAFIKATEGGDRLDDKFAQHWAGAKAAGVPAGAYHFYYFCRPAIEQARWFIRHVPRDRSALPPVLDMEWNHLSPTCKLRPPASTVQAEMRIFLREIERHFGKKPIIYTSIDFFEDNRLAGFTGYPFWLRSVADHPADRYGPHPFTFWQYTGTGKVPGIPGDADINVFNGSEKAWRDWLRANTR